MLDTITTISSAVGVPCALIIAWLIYEVKALKEKVKTLEAERESDRKALNDELSKLYDKLNAIAVDVAFLRGQKS